MRMPWELAEGPPSLIGVKSRGPSKFGRRLRNHLGEPCPYCGVTMNRDGGWDSRQAPSRDHRIPISRGGSNAPENIGICCRRCNEEKGSLTPEEFVAVRAGIASRLDHRWSAERSVAMNPKARAYRERVPSA